MSPGFPSDFLPAGDVLGKRWEVQRVLPGAMGAVVILLDPATGGLIAAKTPRPDVPLDAAVLRRFEIEARNWLTLGAHENVVEALFFEEIDVAGVRRPFLFLEFVDGPTLREVLDHEHRMALPAVLDVITGMAWGMAHAHGESREGARIVHRDLKPDNVFVTRNRIVKVSDFGIARALDSAEDVAAEGAGLGTPFYAAPEQMKDARAAGPSSDVYAFGAVVHHLLTGAPPFPADSLTQLVVKVLRETPRAPSATNPHVPAALDRLVLRCLEKHPSDRPRSFAEVLAEISEIREEDALWTPPERAGSCPACGWVREQREAACTLCGVPLGAPERYAPASPRMDAARPTLGRSGGGRLVIEGVDVRPRVAREGEQALITLRIGNPGSEPVDGVFVPYSLPDRHAFQRPEGHRRGFRGRVPPTADGAPLRVSWTVRPLREGHYDLRGVRVTYRTPAGVRKVLRGPRLELEVIPRAELPLYGRDDERAQLLGCLDRAARSACSVVFGRRGLGKSRLAQEVRAEALARGFLVARGRCLDRGVEVRGALKEALRQLLGMPREERAAAEVTSALVELLGDSARADALLVEFLAAELLGRELPRGESPGVMWSRFASALGRVRPFLLLLEDVHRDPDVASIAVLMASHAGRDDATFMVLMTGRPDLESGPSGQDFVARFERLSDQIGCASRIRLSPLDGAAVAGIVDDVLHPNDFADSAPWLAARLTSVSGGNPLFLGELLRSLRAPGAEGGPLLETHDGRWTAASHLTPPALDRIVPPRVEELIVARLRALPPATARVARASGVLGDTFETQLLFTLIEEAADVQAALRWLEHEGVLRETSDSPPRVRFREPLIPEILARECAERHADEFRAWNAVAADWLLERDDPGGRYALRLARHLAAAGRFADAFRWRLSAARRLSSRQSFRRAADVLREAESLLARASFEIAPADRVELGLLRAEALRFSGDYEGATDAYERLLALAPPYAPDHAAQATAYGKLGKVLEARGLLDRALGCFARGLALRVAHRLDRDVPMSLVNLSGLHLVRGDIERAESYIERAIATATDVEAHGPRARALVLRARVLLARGQHGDARRAVREALRWAREARDRTASADAWNALGTVALLEGRAARARRHLLRALHLRQEIGDLAAVAGSWNNVAAVQELLGDPRAALRGYERAADLWRRIGSSRGLGLALGNVGRVQLELGRPRTAGGTLDEALEAVSRSGDPVSLGAVLIDRARTRLVRSDGADSRVVAAEGELVRARGLLEGRADRDVEAALLLAEAELAEARGETVEAASALRTATALHGLGPPRRIEVLSALARVGHDETAAEEAVRLAGDTVEQRWRARALAALGGVRLAEGQLERAVPELRRASGMLLQSGIAGPDLHRVLVALGRALAVSDPAAAAASRRRAEELSDELRRRGYAMDRLSGA